MKKHAISLTLGCSLVLFAAVAYWLFFSAFSSASGSKLIYIDADDTPDSVATKLAAAEPRQMVGYSIASSILGYSTVQPGCYEAGNGVSTLRLVRNLKGGRQTPVRLVVPSVRTLSDMAQRLAPQLAVSADDLNRTFADTVLLDSLGVTQATLPCLFIPNTYEVYWNISPRHLLEKMQEESKKFWTSERLAKAKAAGLSTEEVITLASIVDQETANNAEKPLVAGMYLNRLKIGMKLQADPTVKFALQRFDLRRILHEHLTVDSPYNTYRYAGLPPGPIAIPSQQSIDAVLNYAHHSYIYMCAKEDFSGTHNFATTYEEHQTNAKRYADALNARNIH